MKVTLWFTLFMMLILTITSGILLFTANRVKQLTIQNRLIETVTDVEKAKKFEMAEKIALPIEDVYISIYDEEGNFVSGILPQEISQRIPLQEDTIREIHEKGKSWYVYDEISKKERGTLLWVRGIFSTSSLFEGENMLLKLFVHSLPLLVILVAIIGYGIIKRGFRPIDNIIETAEKIGEGADLTQRISLGEGHDEIHVLANTFDHMFEKLERAFEKEKQFTADASHELRTPLSVMRAQCEYGIEQAATLEESKENLREIHSQILKMSSLVGDLLTLTRVDEDKEFVREKEEICFSEMVSLIVEQQRELAQEKEIEIKTEIESDLNFYGEQTLLMRMIMNLIENAIQYGKYGGNVWVSLWKEGKIIKLQITDDGIGMEERHLDKIWNRFYRIDESRNPRGNNVGLGLSFVKWIVKAHNGEISVKSQPGKGSTFIASFQEGKE